MSELGKDSTSETDDWENYEESVSMVEIARKWLWIGIALIIPISGFIAWIT